MSRYSVPSGRLLKRVPGHMTTVGAVGTERQSLWSRRVPSQAVNLGPEADRACWLSLRTHSGLYEPRPESRGGTGFFKTGSKQSRKKLFVEVCQEIELLRSARQKSREIQRRMDSENVGTFRKAREDDWTQSDLLLPFRAGRAAAFTQQLTCQVLCRNPFRCKSVTWTCFRPAGHLDLISLLLQIIRSVLWNWKYFYLVRLALCPRVLDFIISH